MLRYALALVALVVFMLPASAETLNAGGVAMVDLPSSSAEAITLDIKQGRFADHSVGQLTMTATGINLRDGTLKGLRADVRNGNFDNFLINELLMNANAFSFDTMELLNNKRFVLDNPVNAAVQLKISEENLNHFLTNPNTLEKLEKAVAKKIGNIRLIKFTNPSLELLGGNKVAMTLTVMVGESLGAPFEMEGKMGIKNNRLAFNNLKVTNNGTQLPVDLGPIFEKHLNELIDFAKIGKKSFVINAKKLKVTRKTLEIDGDASLTRLEFGM